MCDLKLHTCRDCKNEYACRIPNWACPTVNGDEDGEMCDDCLDRFLHEMEDFETAQRFKDDRRRYDWETDDE